jgi:hypothetical protein
VSSIRTTPTEWPLVTELPCSALAEIEDQALREAIITTATSLLWNWTGRVFGLSTVSIRPCRKDCMPSTYQGYAGIPSPQYANRPFLPVLIDGEFFNLKCGRSCGSCGCRITPEIGLPGPVDSIVEIKLDGEILDESAYRVDNRYFLVRTDGHQWPTCQDLTLDTDDEGTWEVTYRWGTPVPPAGQLAASILACEMAKSALGRDCDLPQRVQSVTREGVTVAIVDSFEGLEAGRTGIWLVDSFVTSVTKSPRRSRVLSPDLNVRRSRTH